MHMSALTALLHQRHTRAAVAIWAIVPTVFLFFALTLAVNPTDNLDRLRVGVAVLDEGVVTPDGEVSIGPRLLEGIGGELGATAVPYPTEAALSEAILARDVNLGIVVPAGMTEAVLAGAPAELRIVRTDANDAFVNAFSANLPAQLSANLAAVLPSLTGGGESAAPAIAVGTSTIAPTTDFRFPALPATLLLPLWMASVAFGALLTRTGDEVRARFGAVRTGVAELVVTTVAAALVAAVIAVDIALFSWRGDLDLPGLFAILWVGLVAIGWLVVGAIRLAGLALGVALGITALFIQQPISGAATPASFAPDAVRWLEPVAPLRYLVEGMRNVLIGGSTTSDMLVALGALALVAAALAFGGMARLALLERDGHVHRETLATA
jgi:hypothetical protein